MKRFYDSLFYVIFKNHGGKDRVGGTFSGGGGGGATIVFSVIAEVRQTALCLASMSCIIKVYLKLQIQPEIPPKKPLQN